MANNKKQVDNEALKTVDKSKVEETEVVENVKVTDEKNTSVSEEKTELNKKVAEVENSQQAKAKKSKLKKYLVPILVAVAVVAVLVLVFCAGVAYSKTNRHGGYDKFPHDHSRHNHSEMHERGLDGPMQHGMNQ